MNSIRKIKLIPIEKKITMTVEENKMILENRSEGDSVNCLLSIQSPEDITPTHLFTQGTRGWELQPLKHWHFVRQAHQYLQPCGRQENEVDENQGGRDIIN